MMKTDKVQTDRRQRYSGQGDRVPATERTGTGRQETEFNGPGRQAVPVFAIVFWGGGKMRTFHQKFWHASAWGELLWNFWETV